LPRDCHVANALDEIVARKRVEIDDRRRACPVERLRDRLAGAPPVRDFAGALQKSPGIGLIAEIKKASPSAGLIRADFDPPAFARVYEAHGAACISVLTDEPFFQGRLEDLTAVRRAVGVPVLRKDFLLDRYQVLEARAAGADCVLLIAECLAPDALRELHGYAAELGMQALVEIYEPENLDGVLSLHPLLLGINNRNLKTFATDLDHTLRLLDRVPPQTLVVSESGIRTRADVLRLERAGVRAILVGESLMREADIGAKVDDLLGRRTRV
ncbi:MAG TPA: indole-3-glycerol phosphate synthase TrpC, partial [Planctomycetaceae bacterium]|nr:indole-3-glycerol phosphate synthase TrpC [Planctomycetaceae bacterium]